MQQAVFGEDMVRTRALMRWATLALLALALICLGVYLIWGQGSLLVVELLSSLGLVVFLAVLIFLLVYYWSRPQTRQKRGLQKALAANQKQTLAGQDQLAAAVQNHAAVREQVQAAQEEIRRSLEQALNKLDARLESLRSDHAAEIEHELTRLQDEFMHAGLRAVALDPAAIPGIGDVFSQRLAESGILTAADVTHQAVTAIPGFGESKALSLVRWRESLEAELRQRQPAALPAEMLTSIEERYARQIALVDEQRAAALADHDARAAAGREEGARQISAAGLGESEARQTLLSLEDEKQNLGERLKAFGGVTFFNLLRTALTPEPVNWKTRALAYLTVGGFFLLGALHAVVLVLALFSSRGA